MPKHEMLSRLSADDFVSVIAKGVAVLSTYWIATGTLNHFVGKHDDVLGGMWAVIATVFVFRHTRTQSLSAAASRLFGTIVSILLCLIYLLVAPFTPLGLALVLVAEALIMTGLNRREDIVTASITTTVIMIVASVSPEPGWRQPLLRLFDTVVGLAVGVAFRWLAYALLARWRPEQDGDSSIGASRRALR
jgi:uncharacterized membrane protein YccC